MSPKFVQVSFLIFSFFFVSLTYADAPSSFPLTKNLKLGDNDPSVLNLQKFLNTDPDTRIALSGAGSSGQETTYFGQLTQLAVIKFQAKYFSDILIPARLSRGNGFVGALTRAKLAFLFSGQTKPVSQPTTPANIPPPPPPPIMVAPTKPAVSIEKVSPAKVRAGDTVTITGSGFTPTGNSILLQYGFIEKRFDNLSSPDGKTITFSYEPPDVHVTLNDLYSLPASVLANIQRPLLAAGGSLQDMVTPYQGISSLSGLDAFLRKNGSSIENLYDQYFVTVQNQNGSASTKAAPLAGLRRLPFPISFKDRVHSIVSAFSNLIPRAYAQGQSGGGFNTGMIMYCTCSAGFLTFMMDISGGGTGLYYFSQAFRPDAGTGMVSGMWLGFYQQSAGSCQIYAGYTCISITANAPQNPWGASM